MTSKILDCLRINPRTNQVCDICMPQLVWCHLKIHGVDDRIIVSGTPAEFGLDRMFHFLAIWKIAGVCSLFCRSDGDICPQPFELSVGQRAAISTAWYDKV